MEARKAARQSWYGGLSYAAQVRVAVDSPGQSDVTNPFSAATIDRVDTVLRDVLIT